MLKNGVSYPACCVLYFCNDFYISFTQCVLYAVRDSTWLIFFFLYHSIVGLLVNRGKFVNINHLQQGEHTKVVMSQMVVEMLRVPFSEELSLDGPLHCLVSWEGEFIIPRNRVFGNSRNQLVLDRLSAEKKKKKKKRKQKGVEEEEGGDKKSTEDAECGESRKSPPELTGDGGNASC